MISFPFPPDDGEPLSKQQAGPEAGVTVGRVGCHASWGLLEGGMPAGPKDTPPPPPPQLLEPPVS